MAPRTLRIRLGAVSLAIAGVLLVLYPALRPYSDEKSLQGAEAFASARWSAAHMMAMVGFTLVALGLLGFLSSVQGTAVERLATWGYIASLVGIALILPYYGGETFGLRSIGQEALRRHDATLVSLAGEVRYGPGIYMFGTGLLALAAGAIAVAVAVWRSHALPRWAGIAFALGFSLYLPQFFGPPPVRVAHGVLVAAGCAGIGYGMWRQVQLVQGRFDAASA